jgi:quinol monooxygenase YgiN
MRAKLRLAEVDRARQDLTAGGASLADTKAVAEALSNKASNRAARRQEIYALHETWLVELTGFSFDLGTAFGLGRALAETCREPSAEDLLDAKFNRGRVSVLSGWLDDLAVSFPKYSAFAVKSSLHAWTRWFEALAAPPEKRRFSLRKKPEQPVLAKPELVAPALERQGKIWFSLLGAGASPQVFLIAENYVDAAANLIQRSGELARAFRKGWALTLVVMLVGVVAVVLVAIFFLQGSSRAATVIAAVVGGAGISWKAIGTTIGSIAKKLEGPLWEAEVRLAVAAAATRLPHPAKGSGAPPATVI